VRPRSASEWRAFWHHGGEAELRVVLRDAWPPLRDAPEEACVRPAERIATLLGSNAPARALASELGRIRDELGAVLAADEDSAAADAVLAWFREQALRTAPAAAADGTES
jgi:hypothetical protein